MKTTDETARDATDYLHWPGRKNCLESTGEHLHSAARFARVLWTALCNPELENCDMRDLWSLQELAALISDHASAAEYAYSLEREAKKPDEPA